jgi:hypothetical protein
MSSEERTMNFRQCVIDCIAGGEVVQSFNRLHGQPIAPHLLSLLSATGHDHSFADLAEPEQEVLACFILFVHRHVWRKVKFAESRVTRVTRIRDESDGGNSRHSRPIDDGIRSFVRRDGASLPDFGASLNQESP